MKLAAAVLPLSLLALSAPAGAQTAEENYQAGVAARRAGDPEAALRLLVRAAAAEPDNSDIHLQIGLVHLALGQLDQAEAAFRRTLELAPDYADARQGLTAVAERRAGQAAASMRPWRWRIDLDGSYSQVDTQPDWRSAALTVQRRAGADTVLAVGAEITRRFDRTDLYVETRIDHGIGPGAHVYLSIGGAPDADHRPHYQLGLGASVRTHSGPFATVLRLAARQADFPSGKIQTVSPGVEQYISGRAWLTAQWINVWDRFTHSAGWLVRGDVMPTDRLRLFAGAADAPDLDSGAVVRTSSLFGGMSLDVGDNLTLRLSLTHDDPKGPADRATIALGMGYRF